jgi:uncharacterized protein
MDVDYRVVIQDYSFIWDPAKAELNIRKHDVTFEEACEVFFYPYYDMVDVSVHEQQRWAFIGYSRRGRLLHVTAVDGGDAAWRIVSAREVTSKERKNYEEDDDTC